MLQTIIPLICLGDIMWIALALLSCTQPEKNPDSEWSECTADFCPDGEYLEADASGEAADQDTEDSNSSDDSDTDDADSGEADDTGDSDDSDDSDGSGNGNDDNGAGNGNGNGGNGDGGDGVDGENSDAPEDEDTGNAKESIECGCREGSSSLGVIFFLALHGVRRRKT